MVILANAIRKFKKKIFFPDLSCTHVRKCVYGRYAPGVDNKRSNYHRERFGKLRFRASAPRQSE